MAGVTCSSEATFSLFTLVHLQNQRTPSCPISPLLPSHPTSLPNVGLSSSTGRPPRKKVLEGIDTVASVRPSPRKPSASSTVAVRAVNKKGGSASAPVATVAATAAVTPNSSLSTPPSPSSPHEVDPVHLPAGGGGFAVGTSISSIISCSSSSSSNSVVAATTAPFIGDVATATTGSGDYIAGDIIEGVAGAEDSHVPPRCGSYDDANVKPCANGDVMPYPNGGGFNSCAAVRGGQNGSSSSTAASGSGSSGVFESRRERDRYSYHARGEEGGTGAGAEVEDGSSDEEDDDDDDKEEESDGAPASKLSQARHGGSHRGPNVINAPMAAASERRQRGCGGGGGRRGRRCISNVRSEDGFAEKRPSAPHHTPDRRLRAAGCSPG